MGTLQCPLCLPGADFHPRWAGRFGWLLVWHSLDDLGRKGGKAHRHPWSHFAQARNRKAVLFQGYSPMTPRGGLKATQQKQA